MRKKDRTRDRSGRERKTGIGERDKNIRETGAGERESRRE